MSVNKIILVGHLGKDPELKSLPSGNQVCNFSIATSEKYKGKKDEAVEKTEWHSCVVFGQLALTCSQYLQKGSQAYVEGKLETRSWEKDGAKHYKTDVIVSTVQFLDKKSDNKVVTDQEETRNKPVTGKYDPRAFDDNANFGGTDFNGRSVAKATPPVLYDQDTIPF